MLQAEVELGERDRAALEGDLGPAMQLAMRTVLQAARIMQAPKLIPATFAHIDACFYAGQAHIDFARFLLEHEVAFAVPTWTNNGLVSLENTGLRTGRSDQKAIDGARELMHLYVQLGARPVWTCAPYQLPDRPDLGDNIVAAESNAVTFYNSAIGARTNKYGDFLDVACALTGKVPFARLHTNEGRLGDVLITTERVPDRLKREEIFYHVLGYAVGRLAGNCVPVISGLPERASEDSLKAVSAAVAAAGGVELWHGVGVTPEAPTIEAAFGGGTPSRTAAIGMDDLVSARDQLSSGGDGPLAMVAFGTPHFSLTEFADLAALMDGRKIDPGTRTYVTTSRFVRDLAQAKGLIEPIERAGAEIITDTCTYFSPRVTGCTGRAMTNAAKWAYYAPGMLDIEVCFGSMRECVESAIRGHVWRDPQLWQE